MNAFSVDLEPWMSFYSSLELQKEKIKDSLYQQVNILSDLFDKHDIKSTIFIQAILYEWFPDLIEDLYSKGHEIAYHTFRHKPVNEANIRNDGTDCHRVSK